LIDGVVGWGGQTLAAKRSALAVRAISFLTDQGLINEKRRRRLADIAQRAEDEWRAGNPKSLYVEKELFTKNPKKRPAWMERKWKLVPILSFNTSAAAAAHPRRPPPHK